MANGKKQPAILFYTGDWIKDPAVSLCSPSTRGIWIDFLCAMHESNRSGIIIGNREQLTRVGRCSIVELDQALSELSQSGAADVVEHNKTITIINRRMKREAGLRDVRSIAGKKGMEQRWHNKGYNKNVTSLENEDVYEDVYVYSISNVKDACILNGIPESNAQSYFDQYNSQGWKKANNQPITNLQSHIAKRWLKSKQCWDFDEKKHQQQETIHEQAERLRKAGELDE